AEGAPLPQPLPGDGRDRRPVARRPDPGSGARLRRRSGGGLMGRRWRCLEVGCGTTVSAPSDEELVAAVNAHVREAHDSYELEEVILAGAEDAPEDAMMTDVAEAADAGER